MPGPPAASRAPATPVSYAAPDDVDVPGEPTAGLDGSANPEPVVTERGHHGGQALHAPGQQPEHQVARHEHERQDDRAGPQAQVEDVAGAHHLRYGVLRRVGQNHVQEPLERAVGWDARCRERFRRAGTTLRAPGVVTRIVATRIGATRIVAEHERCHIAFQEALDRRQVDAITPHLACRHRRLEDLPIRVQHVQLDAGVHHRQAVHHLGQLAFVHRGVDHQHALAHQARGEFRVDLLAHLLLVAPAGVDRREDEQAADHHQQPQQRQRELAVQRAKHV